MRRLVESGGKTGRMLESDLEQEMDVRAVQINFADDALPIESPGEIQGSQTQPRYIEEQKHVTRWKLEALWMEIHIL